MIRNWFELFVVTCILVTSTSFLVRSSPLPHEVLQEYTTLKYWDAYYSKSKDFTTLLPNSYDDESHVEGSEETIVVLSDDEPTITTSVPLSHEKLIVRQEQEDDELEHLYEPSGTTVTFLSEYITNQPDSNDEVSITTKPVNETPENVIVRQEEEQSQLVNEFAQVIEALASSNQKVAEENKFTTKEQVPVQLELQESKEPTSIQTTFNPDVTPTTLVIVREEETPSIPEKIVVEPNDLNDQVIEKIVSEIVQAEIDENSAKIVSEPHSHVDQVPEKSVPEPSGQSYPVPEREIIQHKVAEQVVAQPQAEQSTVTKVNSPQEENLWDEEKNLGNNAFAEVVSIPEKNYPVVEKVIVRQEEEEDDSDEEEEAQASKNNTSTGPPTEGSPTIPSGLEGELASQQQPNSTLIDVQTNQNPEQPVQQGSDVSNITSQGPQLQDDSAPILSSEQRTTSISSITVPQVQYTEATTTITTAKPTTKKPSIQGVQEGLIPFVEAFNSQSHQIGLKHKHKLDTSIKFIPVLEKSEYPETPRPPRPPRTTTPRPRTTTTPRPKTTTPTTTTKAPPANIEQLSFEEEWNKANKIFTMSNIGQGRADCECGKTPFKVGTGDTAGINEYPWTVAIVRTGIFGGSIHTGKPHCSGTLINNKFVLTTASCVESFYPESIQVWLTALNSLHTDNFVSSDFVLKREVKEILMHPNFDRRTNDNDVALIRFASPIDISASSYYVPVCLPAGEGSYDGMFARVVGWTGTTKVNNRVTNTNTMCKEDVPVISNTVCNRDTTHKNRITVNQVCAGYLSRLPAETCHMDGGGPLTIPNGGRFTLIGLVSYGHSQRQSYTPIVYSRIGSYADWILHNTQDSEWCSL